jgi:hypothetical protein
VQSESSPPTGGALPAVPPSEEVPAWPVVPPVDVEPPFGTWVEPLLPPLDTELVPALPTEEPALPPWPASPGPGEPGGAATSPHAALATPSAMAKSGAARSERARASVVFEVFAHAKVTDLSFRVVTITRMPNVPPPWLFATDPVPDFEGNPTRKLYNPCG